MGLELVEIVMDVEERHGVHLDGDDLRRFATSCPQDITVSELCAAFLAAERQCRKCAYSLHGHTAPGRCPECGAHFEPLDGVALWTDLMKKLASYSGVDAARITGETRLSRDLGIG